MSQPHNGDSAVHVDAVDSPQELALQYKEQGNVYYGKKEYEKAAEAYQAGLDCSRRRSQSCQEDEEDVEPIPIPKTTASVAIALRSNLAMALLKLQRFDVADIECSRILLVDPQNVKGAFVLVGWLWFFGIWFRAST